MYRRCRCLKINFLALNNLFYIIKGIYFKEGLKYTQGTVINVMDHYMM